MKTPSTLRPVVDTEIVVTVTGARVERRDPAWLAEWGGYVDAGLWAVVSDGTILVWTCGRIVALAVVSPLAWLGHRCTAALARLQPEVRA